VVYEVLISPNFIISLSQSLPFGRESLELLMLLGRGACATTPAAVLAVTQVRPPPIESELIEQRKG